MTTFVYSFKEKYLRLGKYHDVSFEAVTRRNTEQGLIYRLVEIWYKVEAGREIWREDHVGNGEDVRRLALQYIY